MADYPLSTILDFKFRTSSGGVGYTLSGVPVVSVYKGNSVTQSTTGVTLSADFDGVTGFNNVRVDTSADGTFYSAGGQFAVVITTGTVNGISQAGFVIDSFSLLATSALSPTVAGRTLDVSAGGEAGVDWANVGSPTTVVGLSGTTVKTATDVETDTQDIQSRIPAALTANGNIKADSLRWNGLVTVALPLVPTVAGNTLDVSAGGEAGLDWDNVGSPAAVVGLSQTAIGDVGGNVNGTVASVTGNVGGSVVGSVASVTGNIGGSVLGNVSGNLGGSVTGNVNGNVTGNVGGSVGSVVGDVQGNIQGDINGNANGIVDAIWDEQLGGHIDAGSTGEALGDASVGVSVPTAIQNADALLNRNMALVADTNSFSPLNAMRSTRNAWNTTVVPGSRRVYKEDGTTTAFDQVLDTNPAAVPIVGAS